MTRYGAEADGDAAKFALTSAVHRLRRLLGQEQSIVRQDNEISLNEHYCWVDVCAVERLISRSEAAIRRDGYGTLSESAIELIERARELYRGGFLNEDAEAPWATAMADRVRRRLLRQMTLLGEHWQRREDLVQAVAVYEEALRIDPCAEDVCRRLMAAYHTLGRPAEVRSVYRGLKAALMNRVCINPSPETEALAKRLQSS